MPETQPTSKESVDLFAVIARELGARTRQVAAAVQLLDEGATVPFVARYRKEHTGGLDDVQLRHLEDRLGYLRDMEARRAVILKSIDEQGKLTSDLETRILAAETKSRLEDLYLPFRPKRRTKALIAREAGLEPLANQLLEVRPLDLQRAAMAFVDEAKGISDSDAALNGARHILMERFSEDADLLSELRGFVWDHGALVSRVRDANDPNAAKYRDYFSHEEKIKPMPSHRLLAVLRGQREEILRLKVVPTSALVHDKTARNPCLGMVARRFGIPQPKEPASHRNALSWLWDTVSQAWKTKLGPRVETDLIAEKTAMAEEEAIGVFASNLRDLLLAPPAGCVTTMGLDPGIRTGVKVAVVDGTGKVLCTGCVYPFAPKHDRSGAMRALRDWCGDHRVELIAIGNGTASRETEALVKALLKEHPGLAAKPVVVSESGASVYSASDLASAELPDLDVSLRGAVSIARRLQDPLAELVKIDPRSIGVGQYQHDVNHQRLCRSLDAVVEDAVNAVGVDVNTASVPLLARVSGLNRGHAEALVSFRNDRGTLTSRRQLLDVPRLGPKTFEQAAGFLRIPHSENPLDASAVHPEAYGVVRAMAARTGKSLESMMGDPSFLNQLDPRDYVTDRFGLPTIKDILEELKKPGRDPRGAFVTAQFADGVQEIGDLEAGMNLEGTVTNVTKFGAFVDVGVHQDGLVHISEMADHFVRDPRDEVRVGQIVRVQVLEVDLQRRRISLTMCPR